MKHTLALFTALLLAPLVFAEGAEPQLAKLKASGGSPVDGDGQSGLPSAAMWNVTPCVPT